MAAAYGPRLGRQATATDLPLRTTIRARAGHPWPPPLSEARRRAPASVGWMRHYSRAFDLAGSLAAFGSESDRMLAGLRFLALGEATMWGAEPNRAVAALNAAVSFYGVGTLGMMARARRALATAAERVGEGATPIRALSKAIERSTARLEDAAPLSWASVDGHAATLTGGEEALRRAVRLPPGPVRGTWRGCLDFLRDRGLHVEEPSLVQLSSLVVMEAEGRAVRVGVVLDAETEAA